MEEQVNGSEAWVSASEVAAYAYCAESWRLAYGLGRESRQVRLMEQGIEEYAAWQDVERISSRLLRLGVALMLAALAGLLLLGG